MNKLHDKTNSSFFLHNHRKDHFRQLNITMMILLGLYLVASILIGPYFFALHIHIVPMEFVIYAMMLLGIATFTRDNITVATFGFMGILIYKLTYNPNFELLERLMGVNNIYEQIIEGDFRFKEWFVVFNLLGIFLGLPIMASHFMKSKLVDVIIPSLRQDWTTPLLLLIVVFVLSVLINDITATLIGVVAAIIMFSGKLHIGYVVAIVATANIGGIGNISDVLPNNIISSLGVTTKDILLAYIGGFVAFVVFAPISAIAQYKKEALVIPEANHRIFINSKHLIATILIIGISIITKYTLNSSAIGVWVGIAISTCFVQTDWKVFERTIPCSVFLMLLIFAAGLMPVDELPQASTVTTFALGLVSSFFNNIPLMKLALEQEGYNLPLLIYSINLGGSLLWFGSAAGIAISNIATEARAVSRWVYYGWFVVLAYIIGFLSLYGLQQLV